jgi:hypothetical protein
MDDREFGDLNLYREMVGKTVQSVGLEENADEGIVIQFTDGSWLAVGFSGCEGSIEFHREKTCRSCKRPVSQPPQQLRCFAPEEHGYQECDHCNGYGSSLKDRGEGPCSKCGGSGLARRPS